MLKIGLPAALLAAGTAWAEPPLACDGYEPDWFLTLAGPVVQLRNPGTTNFEITTTNIAKGHKWPRSYNLTSETQTAVVLVNETSCSLNGTHWPLTVHMLLQHGPTTTLLTGCCSVAE